MNSVKKQCHLKAISENFELALLGGVLASGFDTVWVICDIAANGLSTHYVFILVALLLSTALISVALVRHHMINVHNSIGTIYELKKQLIKHRIKHERKLK